MISLGWWAAYWWLILLESLVGLFIIGGLTLAAPRLVGREPSSLGRLKASMALTLALIILAYAGIVTGLTVLFGGPESGAALVLPALIIAGIFSLLQWLFSPFIINLAYRTRPPQTAEEKRVEAILHELARRSGFSRAPKLRIVDTSMPNAFTYTSPLTGPYVAVTSGLLRISSRDELEAVLGHELGHLKHRDVGWILALSIVPLAIYFLGRSLVYASIFSGYSSSRREGNQGATLLVIGIALIALGFLFRLLIAHYNRLREYYADAHSTVVLGKGRPLQRALTKIYIRLSESPDIRTEGSLNLAQALFIVAPLIEVNGGFFAGSIDSLVEAVKREKVNPLTEILSTHPPVPKRLRFIDKLLSLEAIRGGV